MKKPVLTISLLCCGRAEVIKCLDSMENLRKRVPSELIIVDTGCSEEMRERLSGYTDNIIPFTWCSDFAAARNAGLKAARGEWFMFVDDDEYFMDTEEIEKFFLSGEYRNYGSANYYVRNFADYEEKVYTDSWVTRLTVIEHGVHFEGIIHELFEPRIGPVKLLPSVAKHFGYAFKTMEDSRKHSERNITLLKKALEKQRKNTRIWMHLAQEYYALKEYEKLAELCREALAEFEGQNDGDVNRDRGCFYCGLVDAGIRMNEYEEAVKEYERALTDRRNTDFCTARLMVLGADVFHRLGDETRVEECCRRYLKLWNHYENRPDELFRQEAVFVKNAFHVFYKNWIYSYVICADLERGNTASLEKYFDKLDWKAARTSLAENFMPCLVKAMSQLPCEKIFVHAADVLINKPETGSFLEEIKKIEDTDGLHKLGEIFAKTEITSFDYYCSLVEEYLAGASWKRVTALKAASQESADSVREEYYFMVLEVAAVVCAGKEDEANGERGAEQLAALRELLMSFVDKCQNFYRKFYTERAFQGEMEFLPSVCRAAVKLREMLLAQEEDDWERFSGLLKEAVGVYPDFSDTLKKYAELYAEERMKKMENKEPKQEISEEMQALAVQIKAQISALMAQGMTREASQVLQQLKAIMPGDEELEEIERKISLK